MATARGDIYATRRRVEAARRDAEEEQRAYTQEQLVAALDVPQSQVSRIERQADLYVSTLARYLEAMGGRLELVGVFDDRRVSLALGDLTRPVEQAEDVNPSAPATPVAEARS